MSTKTAGSVRVVCLSHALTEKDISTVSIEQRRQEQGRRWYTKGNQSVDIIDWLRFPFAPARDSGARLVDVRFKIIALMGRQFFDQLKSGLAYQWTKRAILQIIEEARRDGVEHVFIGLGAYTKNATHHGDDLIKDLEIRPYLDYVTFVHGDPGTVQLVVEMIKDAGFAPNFSVAIVGANGAIGEPLARMLPNFDPKKIVLIGKSDKQNDNTNRLRLEDLAHQVDLPSGQVVVAQDETACREYHCNLVIVATNDHHFPPESVAKGTLVLDIAAPNACWPDQNNGWDEKMVLLAGCGQFAAEVLPEGFGIYNGQMLKRVIGGEREFWGCMMNAVTQGAYDYRHNVVGRIIKDNDIAWVATHFDRLGCRAQEPNMFQQPRSRADVRDFVRISSPPPVRSAVAVGAHK